MSSTNNASTTVAEALKEVNAIAVFAAEATAAKAKSHAKAEEPASTVVPAADSYCTTEKLAAGLTTELSEAKTKIAGLAIVYENAQRTARECKEPMLEVVFLLRDVKLKHNALAKAEEDLEEAYRNAKAYLGEVPEGTEEAPNEESATKNNPSEELATTKDAHEEASIVVNAKATSSRKNSDRIVKLRGDLAEAKEEIESLAIACGNMDFCAREYKRLFFEAKTQLQELVSTRASRFESFAVGIAQSVIESLMRVAIEAEGTDPDD